jgi:hypothetical protein
MIFLPHVRAYIPLKQTYPFTKSVSRRRHSRPPASRQDHACTPLRGRESKREVSFLDPENAVDLALFVDPMITLRPLKGLIAVDEVQRLT